MTNLTDILGKKRLFQCESCLLSKMSLNIGRAQGLLQDHFAAALLRKPMGAASGVEVFHGAEEEINTV